MENSNEVSLFMCVCVCVDTCTHTLIAGQFNLFQMKMSKLMKEKKNFAAETQATNEHNNDRERM